MQVVVTLDQTLASTAHWGQAQETLFGAWLAQPEPCQELGSPSDLGPQGWQSGTSFLRSSGPESEEGAGGHRAGLRADHPETGEGGPRRWPPAQLAPCCCGPPPALPGSSHHRLAPLSHPGPPSAPRPPLPTSRVSFPK